MAHKKSIGRKASDEAREEARALVDIYGPALRSPTGGYCVNADDASEEPIFVSVDEAGRSMLAALERLARTGWLTETAVCLDHFLVNEEYKRIKASPKAPSKTKAIAELKKKYPRSERELQRIIVNDKR